MLDYYQREGVGAIDEIEVDDILHLKMLEEQNVPLLLGPEEKRRVMEAKEAYKKVQKLYEHPQTAFLAELILEEEEHLEEVKEEYLPALVDLLHDSAFSNPLFPGYGLAPVRAAKALGLLRKEAAAQALFERLLHIGDEESYLQEEILAALSHAKDFLIARLKSRPVTGETVAAAMALGATEIDAALIQLVKEEAARLRQEGVRDEQLLSYLEALYN